jgi:hypothetical protein
VLPTGSGPYTLVAANAACSSAGNLALVNADNTINYYDGSGSATSPALNDAAGFNAQLFSVLKAATSGLAVGDKITVDAKGIITGAEITVATPSAAKINAVLGVLDNVTIGASGTGLAAITIPASKTLKVAGSGVLGLASSDAALTITGTLLVDDGNNNTVTIEKAVITPAAADAAIGTGTTGAVLVVGSKVELAAGGSITAAGTATFTVGSGNTFALEKGTVANPTNASVTLVASNGAAAGGTVVLPAATTLTLENGGAITIVGTGTLTAGLTTFGGAGLWTASGAAVTITGNANGAIITAPDGTAASTLTGTGTAPAITQNTGAGNVLTIEAGVTLDTTAASIVLKSDASNPGKLVLAPKSGSAAHGGGAKLVINSSSATDASVAKSGQTAANLTATGTAAAALTFTATANTVITNIPANSNAATIKSLEAATSQNTDGTITLIGYSSDVTVSAAATFEYHA